MSDLAKHTGLRAIAKLSIAGIFLLGFAASAQTPIAKAVGTVKSVGAGAVVLTTDSGAEQTVTFADTARIVRAVPGQTDLKTAPSIAVSDIQVGDRVFARGQAGEGSSVVASSAIVMKQSDIAAKQQQERDEWGKGIGGIVKQVDAAANTITINNAMIAAGKPIIIHLSPATTIRRYAPDSVKFDDARPGTLDQIKPGNQLRARGTKNDDGTEFTAQGIITGAFRDIAGTVVSTDVANNTVTVTDLATKKPVTVKVTADSQLRKLPPFVAMGIAMRLKGISPGAMGGGAPGQGGGALGGSGQYGRGAGNAVSGPSTGGSTPVGAPAGAPGSGAPGMSVGQGGAGGQGAPGGNWRGAGGGTPDFQQMLSRMPAAALTDLNKGDAVMIEATEGSEASGSTAITLLSGVEPILTAAPAGVSAASILSPWNLSAPAGAGGD
jgi:co-chaperonin GroES (HSP10)